MLSSEVFRGGTFGAPPVSAMRVEWVLLALILATLSLATVKSGSRFMVALKKNFPLGALLVGFIWIGWGWTPAFKLDLEGWGGLWVQDGVGLVLKGLILGLLLVFALYTREKGLSLVHWIFIDVMALGSTVLVSARHSLAWYLGLELLSLAQVIFLVSEREEVDRRWNTEAALKYLILSALTSGLLLFGLGLWYGLTGRFDLTLPQAPLQYPWIAVLAGLFALLGISFKWGIFPCHWWLPDLYQASSHRALAMMAALPKIGAFGFCLRFLQQTVQTIGPSESFLISVLGLISVLWGNLGALGQVQLRRLMGYSAIGHLGFLILGFNLADGRCTFEAALLYLLVYVGLVQIFFLVLDHLKTVLGVPLDVLEDLKVLGKGSSAWKWVLVFLLINLAGLPPTLGFYAKFAVLEPLLLRSPYAGALVAAASLVGLYYHLQIIRHLFFDAFRKEEALQGEEVGSLEPVGVLNGINRLGVIGLGGVVSLCLFAGLYPTPLLRGLQWVGMCAHTG